MDVSNRSYWPLVTGGDAGTRAAIRRALRDGHSTSAYIDGLVRGWQQRWRRRRWLVPVAAAGYLVAALLSNDPGLRVVLAAGVVLLVAAALAAEFSNRRLRHYRGLTTEHTRTDR